MDALIYPFRKGMIILWSGAIADIPSGWQICDGTNGSPNLKNSFVVGAGDSYVVDAVGGSANHLHSFNGDGHTHGMSIGVDIQAGSDLGLPTDSTLVEGDTDSTSGLPPYHALAYIMKL